ncbi:endonuclease III domain-containing protein [Natronomonas salsuginis]|uniref:Endonuclease III n=1 Tax=Natronomonas salsuginis TaxID=2217661 RepID=A0A4U5JFR6_9EURY|nr:endonuclease III [Natronomonas salsuginis]TKR28242.1 endonuclease III [Natronomonas salsuginis]
MDDEPAENISGGESGGGAVAQFDSAGSRTRAEAVVDRLGELYWRKRYGGRDGFECLVRTILSQNTSDVASQPAHDALMDHYGHDDLATALAEAVQSELAETISSAGLYNQKSERIIAIAERVVDEYGSTEAFDRFVREESPSEVRGTLLDMNGVGPKTADCVLLFAGGRGGVFPVDTHVHRIARRMGLALADADHEGVREALEAAVPAEERHASSSQYTDVHQEEFSNGGTYDVGGAEITFAHGGVPPEKCGFGHTATIQFGREYCTARKPACLDGPESCPLYDLCDRVGVYPETGEVFDPSETKITD